MGFFKNIFKRKKGGTKLGNLIRGVASSSTGGMLGSGQGLARWEAKQEGREPIQALPALTSKGYKQLGEDLINKQVVPLMANGGGNSPMIGESVLMHSLKKNWYLVAGVVIALVGGTYLLTRKKRK